MKSKVPLILAILLAGAMRSPAEAKEYPKPASDDVPHSALEALKGYIQRSPPPLEVSDARTGLYVSAGAGLASVGCAMLALIPTFQTWGPEEERGQYGSSGLGWGALQGLVLNSLMGIGLTDLVFPRPDLRAEYGRLLDLDEPEQEQRAYLILRTMAGRAKQRRMAIPLFALAATAIPAGAYYLGSAIAGPNPNVKSLGTGYVVGIALGALVFTTFPMYGKSAEEILFDRVSQSDPFGGAK
jgi:hypothetical protein